MLSDGERYLDHAVVQHIAAQWVGQPSVGLLVVLPSAAPMVVLRFEAPTAELRFEAPYMVGAIVPTLALQRGSLLGRLPVQLRLRPIAIHHPTAHRHPTTSPGSTRISCKCADKSLVGIVRPASPASGLFERCCWRFCSKSLPILSRFFEEGEDVDGANGIGRVPPLRITRRRMVRRMASWPLSDPGGIAARRTARE
jgi:hypothetical protein